MSRLIILSLLILSSANLNAQTLNDSLLLHYPMNGNCNDISGNGFHAAYINATLTNDHNGNANSAYHFNGSSEYIDWPSNPVLHPALPITIAFWVKYDVNDFTTTFLFDTDFAQNNYSGIHCNLSPSMQVSFSFGDGSGSTSPSARRSKTGTSSLQINTWYFIVGVIRGANDMDIYINCVNDGGTYSGTGGPMAYTGTPGILGRSDGDIYAPAAYFNGSLDDFRYWHRALSAAEILSLCNSNNPAIQASGCYDGLYTFSLQNAGSYSGIAWDFGDPASGVNNTSALFSPNHQFSAPGTYLVTAVVSYYIGSPVSTTYSVTVPPMPDLIPYDTVFECLGSSRTITVQGIWETYLWSNFATTPSITVSASGQYSVTVTDSSGCNVSDTLVAVFDNTSLFELDTTICSGTSIVYDGQTISAGGDYTFTHTSVTGCDTIIELHVQEEFAPGVLLPSDTIICIGELLYVSPVITGSWFTAGWADGYSVSGRYISSGGTFTYVAAGNCGVAEDVFSVDFDSCLSSIIFPNVFTPNRDGYNDEFAPIGTNIFDFHITVFNRWGKQVFESNSADDGWDGSSNGQNCADGVYYWIADYKLYKDNLVISESATGCVTLFR